jgi:FKBP-type peptidyl-prolyl cis-trans isomerase
MKKAVLLAALWISSSLLFTPPSGAEERTMEEKITALKIVDNKVGQGNEAKSGSTVSVDYTGWIYDPSAPDKKGKKFDSSLDRGDPFSFVLGRGAVIRGWDEGVKGMKEDGQRTLIIPPEMAYGKRGAGGVIPPDATLLFDVELISVK